MVCMRVGGVCHRELPSLGASGKRVGVTFRRAVLRTCGGDGGARRNAAAETFRRRNLDDCVSRHATHAIRVFLRHIRFARSIHAGLESIFLSFAPRCGDLAATAFHEILLLAEQHERLYLRG